jgi:hypothetical protein
MVILRKKKHETCKRDKGGSDEQTTNQKLRARTDFQVTVGCLLKIHHQHQKRPPLTMTTLSDDLCKCVESSFGDGVSAEERRPSVSNDAADVHNGALGLVVGNKQQKQQQQQQI